jgi:phosphate-selective porin
MPIMRKLTALAAMLLLLPCVSQASSLEELLVEKGVITRSEMRASQHDGAAKVYWNQGTRLDFADTGFTAKINTQLQTRYTFTDNDGGSNDSEFSVRRARLMVSGTALHEEFSYRLQMDFAGTSTLKDAYLQWNACDNTSVRMGRYKTAISRQYNNTSAKLQFAERSIASEYYDHGRQEGVKAMMGFMDDKIMLSLGVADGTDTGVAETDHLYEGAVRVDIMGGMDAYEEGDINGTEGVALNWGAAVANEHLADTSDDVTVSSDINLKSGGASVHAELFYKDEETADSDTLSFYGQVGYFVMPKKLEVAGRYARIDCDNGRASGDCAGLDTAQEYGVGLNYYWWKHNLKAQLNWSRITEEDTGGTDADNDRFIFQLASYF